MQSIRKFVGVVAGIVLVTVGEGSSSAQAQDHCVKEVTCSSQILATQCSTLRSIIVSAALTKIRDEPTLCQTFEGAPLTFYVYTKVIEIRVTLFPSLLKKLGVGTLAIQWDAKLSRFSVRDKRTPVPVAAAHRFLLIVAPNLTEKGMTNFETAGSLKLSLNAGASDLDFAVDRSGSYNLLWVRLQAENRDEEYLQEMIERAIKKSREHEKNEK